MSLIASYLLPHPPIILKEIGQEEVKKARKTIESCELVAKDIEEKQVDTIIVLTPHNVMYQDYFHVSPGPAAQGSFAHFGHPELALEVAYDQELRKELIQAATKENLPIGTLGEKDARLDHGVMVPLSFLKGKQTIVRISLSGEDYLSHYHLGQVIQKVADQSSKRIVLLASGDLSHVLKEDGPYGFAQEGPIFDELVTKALKNAAFDQILAINPQLAEDAKECGLRSILIMAGALDQKDIAPTFYSYEGPFGVGYAVAKYEILGENKDNAYKRRYLEQEQASLRAQKNKEDAYVSLARHSLEHYLVHHTYLSIPNDLPVELLDKKQAVFVTLKKHGRLRGCIGTLEPTKESLAEEIIYNAVSAGLRDPRFPQVTIEELPQLSYSVDVLSSPEEVQSVEELDPKLYGVIIYTSRKSGLLLPNLEGIDTVEKQLDIVKQKANIDVGEDYKIKRFKVVRHL
jgi:AmmeMemoRadiSam system protein A/AmmeMemoRadiSam system protein B